MKVVTVLLILICAGLGYGLYQKDQKAKRDAQEMQSRIALLSKDLQETGEKLKEQQQVNAKLDTDLTERNSALETTSNKLLVVKAELADTQVKAEADAKAAETTIAQKQEQIQSLEGENQNLNTKMSDLTTAIGDLEGQIADTERKLAASEGDREFLLAELKRMQAEKIDLERQFNDLALLRDQIRKLKDELSIASRLEWIRRGLYGSEPETTAKLQPGFAPPPTTDQGVDLEVEIRQDGGARVVATNAPAVTP